MTWDIEDGAFLTAKQYFQDAEKTHQKITLVIADFISNCHTELSRFLENGINLVICGSLSRMPGIAEVVAAAFKDWCKQVLDIGQIYSNKNFIVFSTT